MVASDAAGAGTVRSNLKATQYGADTAIFGYGYYYTTKTNLCNNVGVVAADVAGVGTARTSLGACSFAAPAVTQGIFVYGHTGYVATAVSNIVNTSGVVSADVSGVGTARQFPGGCEYGLDKGILGYGYAAWPTMWGKTNLVSNVGVVASDGSAIGTARYNPAGSSYGT